MGPTLAFNAQYDGGTDVYVMPADGGTPRRLTWDPRGARVVGWSPDGANVLFLSRRANPENVSRMWQVPVRGGLPALLPLPRAALAAMAPDGKRVAYVPVSAERQNWKQYRGGQADEIWITDISRRRFRRLTSDPGIDTTPAWAGNALFFVSERAGIGQSLPDESRRRIHDAGDEIHATRKPAILRRTENRSSSSMATGWPSMTSPPAGSRSCRSTWTPTGFMPGPSAWPRPRS